jgi:hypothetical protein
MFRPARLLTLCLLALGIYAGFYAVPGGTASPGGFDAPQVAAYEAEVWRSVAAREDYGVYLNVMMMERALHQYTWFRAAQSAFYLGGAMREFVGMRQRYERILPDLEASAAIEKAWTGAAFDPAGVARAQLNWWVTRKSPDLNNIDVVSELMAEEYALRYASRPGRFVGAARLRAQAAQLHDNGGADPDWRGITRLLGEAYTALHAATAERLPTPLAR